MPKHLPVCDICHKTIRTSYIGVDLNYCQHEASSKPKEGITDETAVGGISDSRLNGTEAVKKFSLIIEFGDLMPKYQTLILESEANALRIERIKRVLASDVDYDVVKDIEFILKGGNPT